MPKLINPPLSAFDPADPAILQDPYPWFEWLRDHSPAFRVERTGVWVLSRYDEVRWALRDAERFSSRMGGRSGNLLLMDPPEHTAVRRIVSRSFSPAAVRRRSDEVQTIIDELVGGFLVRGGGDLVEDVAYRIPLRIFLSILGLPRSDEDDLKRWSDAMVVVLQTFVAGVDPAEVPEAFEGARELSDYLLGWIERSRQESTDGILSLLANHDAAGDEDRLSDQELVEFLVQLLVAGHETTTNLLGSIVWWSVQEPDTWERVRQNRDRVGDWIEEVLRLDSPIQRSMRRVTEDTEIAGITIPADARVLPYIGAANRDPRQFPDPDVLDLDRTLTSDLSFGIGGHYCLGASLARLEGDLFTRTVLDRCGAFAPAGEHRWSHRPGPRGLSSFPVTVVPR